MFWRERKLKPDRPPRKKTLIFLNSIKKFFPHSDRHNTTATAAATATATTTATAAAAAADRCHTLVDCCCPAAASVSAVVACPPVAAVGLPTPSPLSPPLKPLPLFLPPPRHYFLYVSTAYRQRICCADTPSVSATAAPLPLSQMPLWTLFPPQQPPLPKTVNLLVGWRQGR